MKKYLLFAAVLLTAGMISGCYLAERTQSVISNMSPTDVTTEVTAEEVVETTEAVIEKYAKIPAPVAQDGDFFLFVGNSHTYVNDLPGTFYEFATAAGHTIEVYDLTEGSYTLEKFADPQDEVGAILYDALTADPWDFVIIQENTNNAFSGYEKSMLPNATKLDEMIRAAGGQTAFFMTWSPKDGVLGLAREKVQAKLSENYSSAAKALDGLLIPGGDMFAAVLEKNPDIELWDEDGQHPSEAATYLTACGAYALFFQESPVGNSYYGNLDEETAALLQQVADEYLLGTE